MAFLIYTRVTRAIISVNGLEINRSYYEVECESANALRFWLVAFVLYLSGCNSKLKQSTIIIRCTTAMQQSADNHINFYPSAQLHGHGVIPPTKI